MVFNPIGNFNRSGRQGLSKKWLQASTSCSKSIVSDWLAIGLGRFWVTSYGQYDLMMYLMLRIQVFGCFVFEEPGKKQKSIQEGLDCDFATTKYITVRYQQLPITILSSSS